jgi:hypothetical protein
MTSPHYQLDGQRARREQWFEAVRRNIGQVLNADGSARLPQFASPHRETLWAAAALYTGSQESIDLINRAIGRWHDGAPRPDDMVPLQVDPNARETHGTDFGIFQTNTMIHLYHRFHDKLSPEAEKVMLHHVKMGPRTFRGSGQPDTKYHGANDNMPTMATQGLIFSGEILGDKEAVRHGLWYLNKLRLLLSRAAWISEWNSSTYSIVTASHLAQLACYAHTPEVRELALELEHRLWAELLLHYHPVTFQQAGPQSRAYSVDQAGATHSLQLAWWAIFGPEISGRDPLRSYWQPDGREILHFEGCPWQSIAEFVHFLDGDFHVPVELARLITERQYPARLRGRAESMFAFDAPGHVIHTTTYMEEDFSLGSSSVMWSVDQTLNCHVTYRRKPAPRDFRDTATVFLRYRCAPAEYGAMARSNDGVSEGERFFNNQGWMRTMQKDNVVLVQASPALRNAPFDTEVLRLDVVFPSHYGKIARTIIGDGPARAGAAGESAEVVPVSVEAGEVYIHIYPLLPTNLPRTAALRFTTYGDRYEVLELVNYEGPKRVFSRREGEFVANGCVLTVESKKKHASLEAFHAAKSKALVTDYLMSDLRFLEFRRDDVWFEHTYGPRGGTVMTEAIDGRAVPQPLLESSEIDAAKLPFLSGPVAPNFPLFPFKDSMEVCWYPEASWIIGSRGLPEEKPYTRRVEMLRIPPDAKKP